MIYSEIYIRHMKERFPSNLLYYGVDHNFYLMGYNVYLKNRIDVLLHKYTWFDGASKDRVFHLSKLIPHHFR